MKHLYYTNPINENYRIALERSHACDTIVDFRIFCVYLGIPFYDILRKTCVLCFHGCVLWYVSSTHNVLFSIFLCCSLL